VTSERKSFIVKTLTAADCVFELPVLEPYVAPRTQIDLLVVAAGFEERILAVPRRLKVDGTAIGAEVLVGRYRTNAADNERRYEELAPLLMALGAPISSFEADDPTNVVAAVEAALARNAGTEHLHVAFDISGASSTLILSVIAALARSSLSVEVTLFYTTAESYDPPPEGHGEPFVLKGHREEGIGTEPLSGPFGGHHHDHLPASVIALPSMYTDRLEACLAQLNVGPITGSADNLYWLLPSTGVDEHRWRQDHTLQAVRSLMRRLQGRDDDSDDVEVIRPDDMATSDVLDYAEAMRLLIARIDDLPGHNISIVHMGSKLQAIGVSLAAAAREEVAVLTARPASFNAAKYSSGIGSMYLLHFSDFRSVLKAIADIGCLEVTTP